MSLNISLVSASSFLSSGFMMLFLLTSPVVAQQKGCVWGDGAVLIPSNFFSFALPSLHSYQLVDFNFTSKIMFFFSAEEFLEF